MIEMLGEFWVEFGGVTFPDKWTTHTAGAVTTPEQQTQQKQKTREGCSDSATKNNKTQEVKCEVTRLTKKISVNARRKTSPRMKRNVWKMLP